MSPGISFDPSAVSVQRADPRSSAAPGPRLLNRLTGARNAHVAGEVAPAGSSAPEGPRPAVVKAHPSTAAGDMLESLPDQQSGRRQPEEVKKKLELPFIHSRLEIQLLSDVKKASSAYSSGNSHHHQVDIRV